MFFLKKPAVPTIERFLAESELDGFSYPEVGATAHTPPPGYNLDRNRLRIGSGAFDFEHARRAIQQWKMFSLGWVELFESDTPIEIGRTVAILVRHFGLYSLNAARIVYTIDERGDVDRYGFAYGTLAEHGEIGEERFSVEFHRASEEVWYDLYAFSRPGAFLAKLGYPLSRNLQRRFAADSMMAMATAIKGQA